MNLNLLLIITAVILLCMVVDGYKGYERIP